MDRTLYDILELPPSATENEVKSAFRRLALVHHPDINGNSYTSQTTFVLIHHAYQTLASPDRRREYDHYLQTSVARTPERRSAGPEMTNRKFDNRLNTLLWDLEDLIARGRHGRPPQGFDLRSWEREILRVLSFWEKWILEPAGAPDYFMAARQKAPIDPRHWSAGLGAPGHQPFTSVENYFYDIRKRMNRVLTTLDHRNLMEPVAGTGVRRIDGLLEAQDFAIHVVGCLEHLWEGSARVVPPFPPSQPRFTWW